MLVIYDSIFSRFDWAALIDQSSPIKVGLACGDVRGHH